MSAFQKNQKGMVTVYVDGSCRNNGQINAVAGIGVHWGDGHPMNVSERISGKQTNSAAEIKAVTRAIHQAHNQGITKLHVYSDSKSAVTGVKTWIPKWRVNGWKTTGRKDVVNKKEYQALDAAMQKMDKVALTYVPGHSGNYGNEAANRLAQQATEQ